MKNERKNLRDNTRKVLTYFGSLCLGMAVFAGTATLGAKDESSPLASAGDSAAMLHDSGNSSADSASAASAASGNMAEPVDTSQGRQTKAAPTQGQEDQAETDPRAVEMADQDSVMHIGRVIGGIPVVSKSGQVATSRAAGTLALGEPCSCDQDCDAAPGDACNMVQCIVRSFCSGDLITPCTSNADCEAVGAGTCSTDPFNCDSNVPPNCNFVQRCDVVQLVGWPCDADGDFCTRDTCEDDGSGNGVSICTGELDGTGAPLSACGKQCVGGPSNGLRCGQASDCTQGSCQITAGGGCDSAAEACFVGASLATAIGRCCTAGACTETDEATCTGGGGAWYRYRNPEDLQGDGNCLCPKYGSGVSPSGADLGTIGLVRPSGLICHLGSIQTDTMVYCEDSDADGVAINFCQKRCRGGDNEGAPCEFDNPDCAQFGSCSVTGQFCVVANEGADCGICTNIGGQCISDSDCAGAETCDFNAGLTCDPVALGTCLEDDCISNDIEGGCEDGFLNIGDDYSIANGSFLRLSQFRFRGGVSNLAEDFVIEFWNADGTRLVDAFAVNNLGRTGTHDWAIEVDCFPNCDPGQLEIPEQNPIIIPPHGYVVMRSPRTVGTINGAASFWMQTDNPADVGLNDDTKSWVNGDPNGTLGTNVFIFELVGSKVPDPLGACCDDALSCEDTLRWECGLCTDTTTPVLCSNTLNDCPRGGEAGSFCQFNRWFGPISHDDFQGGGADLTTCNGLAPCNTGACCDGSTCTVTTEADCNCPGCNYRGIATDCTPNCCPVDVVSGSDCVCPTSVCVEADGVTATFNLCDTAADCLAGQTCVLQCEPVGVTQLRHPFECHDDFGSPLEPPVACDPANGNADCTSIDPPNTDAHTCAQSFTIPYAVVRNDVIDVVENLFISDDGEACSLNPTFDRVGWYELINLPDPTPLDGADDCYILTVGLCCTDPLLTPIWPFLSEYINCPCVEGADVNGIAPDIDISGDQLDGFGANSKASLPGRCEDGNYSATFTVPPGEYGYQINSDTNCAGSIIPCINNDDCPGTSCVVPNANYSVVFTVESCQIAACCVGDTCILTNELDCKKQNGNFLGGGDQPIVTCQAGACSLGSCCVDGGCKDDEFSDTKAECESQDGNYFGGVACDSNPCPICPFDEPANCQQVQTVFGSGLHWIDRNPENAGDGANGRVLADDVKFGGGVVDEICWNTWFVSAGFARCSQSVDTTWEIRVYDTDPTCPGLPGAQIGQSTISVLNKIEGTGQATATWHYAGTLDAPITLTGTPGLAGDTYWFEVSCFGETGCGCRANWSRDHGNEHSVSADIEFENSVRIYEGSQSNTVDMGFCENSGIGTPPVVLGSCCVCQGDCVDSVSQRDCNDLRGRWTPCLACADSSCPVTPANDDCSSPFLVSNVPASTDGSLTLEIAGENECAIDDGPNLNLDGECSGSIGGNGADLHADVWYAYTADQCGDLTIESCGSADNDQMIAIYDAANGCPLTDANELTCGDDTCGVGAGPGTVTRRVDTGDQLLIRIGGWNVELPGGFNGDPRGSWTTRWSLTTSCAVVKPLKRAAPPHEILKNRYISVDPSGIDGDNPTSLHISVTVDSSEVVGLLGSGPWWANPPVNGGGLSPAVCVSVVTATKPADPPNWTGCSTVHLTGCGIVPTTVYSIVAETALGESSDPILLATQAKPGVKWHGDTVGFFNGVIWTPPNGTTSIDDAVAAIKTFQDPNAFNATHLSVSDVHPNLNGSEPNLIVSIGDVFAIILGFQGQEYPGPDLTQCP